MNIKHYIPPSESDEHRQAKEKLFRLIAERNELYFINQCEEKENINRWNSWELCSINAFAYKDIFPNDAVHSGYCLSCINTVGCSDEDDFEAGIEYLNFKYLEGYNKNIYIKDEESISYFSHPCNFCRHKGKLNCIFVFDIGLSHEGSYSIIIEILDDHQSVHQSKINACKKHHFISLFAIRTKDILNMDDTNTVNVIDLTK